jgi:hypothetical protein
MIIQNTGMYRAWRREKEKILGNDMADGCEALTPSFAREEGKRDENGWTYMVME